MGSPLSPAVLRQVIALGHEINQNKVTIQKRDVDDWTVSATGWGPLRMMVPLCATDTQERAVFLKECFDPVTGYAALAQQHLETLEKVKALLANLDDWAGYINTHPAMEGFCVNTIKALRQCVEGA